MPILLLSFRMFETRYHWTVCEIESSRSCLVGNSQGIKHDIFEFVYENILLQALQINRMGLKGMSRPCSPTK